MKSKLFLLAAEIQGIEEWTVVDRPKAHHDYKCRISIINNEARRVIFLARFVNIINCTEIGLSLASYEGINDPKRRYVINFQTENQAKWMLL